MICQGSELLIHLSLVLVNFENIAINLVIFKNQAYYAPSLPVLIVHKVTFSVEMGAGLIDRARCHSAPTYVYEHCTEPSFSKDSAFSGSLDLRPDFSRCDHGDCYSFIFGLPFYAENAQGVKFTEMEKQFSKKWITELTQFMKSGSPSEEWPDFRQSEQLMSLSAEKSYTRSLTDYERLVESYFVDEVKDHLC